MSRLLLIIDPQVDFITGSLPVPGAVEAMDALAEYIALNASRYRLIAVTADSHPESHCSFDRNGGQWPVHCVAGSPGAAIWPAVEDAVRSSGRPWVLLTKGDNPDVEEYSIIANEASTRRLARLIDSLGITDVDICGLAGDVCVAASHRDAAARFPRVNFHLLSRFSPCIF